VSTRGHVFRLYEDAAGEWRWRLVAPNGRVIADSAEGYTRSVDAQRAAESAAYAATIATVEVQS